eukprot:TRINITY_DN240_c0_g1_i2.p1 TRINITY_DN240_c0_g1~~TRINITY_DN240_c0_g1_i2.p1  ORF type:complete len:525 (-),score=165.41 TRINITY_DN240_c0_g1_i2:34-1608(-)
MVDENGFDLYYNRFENNLKSLGDMITFFKKLSKAESSYSKDIMSITKGVEDAKLWKKTGTEVGTFHDAWTSLHTELQKLAQKHEELAQNINNQAVAMEKFHKEKGNEKKNLVKTGNKLTKDFHESLDKVKKAKDAYYKDHKSADSNEASYSQKKSDGKTKQKDVDKAHKTATESRDKATGADANYQKLLEGHNQHQDQFYKSLMPSLLKDFQKNEEERTRFFKSTMQSFLQTFNTLGPAYTSAATNLGNSFDAINPQKDVSEFITLNKSSAVNVAPHVVYEPYGSEGGVNMGSSIKKGPTTSFGTTSVAGSTSVSNNNASAPASTPVAGSVTIVTPAKVGPSEGAPIAAKPKAALPTFGLTAADDGLTPVEKRKKLEGQLTQVKEMIKTEVKSKKGLDKLTVFYVGDAAAQATAQKEADEQQVRVNTLKAEKKKILAQLEEVSGEAPAGEAGGSEEGEEETEFVEVSAKALFDYNAANDTELAFKAGDILTITEQDASGWWYAELNGKQGFIPNNYIEVVKEQK